MLVTVCAITIDVSLISANVLTLLGRIFHVAFAKVLAQFLAIAIYIRLVAVYIALLAVGVTELGVAIGPVTINVAPIGIDVALIAAYVPAVLAQIFLVLVDVTVLGVSAQGREKQQQQIEDASSHSSWSPRHDFCVRE